MRLIGREILFVNLDPANEFHHEDAETNASTNTKTKTKAKDKDTQKQSPSSHLPYDVILDAPEGIIKLF